MATEAPVLVILEMNGVLIHRARGGRRAVTCRPHLGALLWVFSEHPGRLVPAVWSSMVEHNLLLLVAQVFGNFADKHLVFAWGQTICTGVRRPGG